MKIYLAPMEGVTGYIYRNAYEKHYGGIDKYFTPFVSPTEKYALTPKEARDLDPSNNQNLTLIPQILTAKSEQFIDAAKEISDMGYREINLNLGCPSGTVCAKGKGSGFLPETLKLKRFLEDIYNYSENNDIKISIKTRLGYYNPEEFYDLVEIFNEFPVHELIVHPRIRSDFYKGEPRLEYYQYAMEHTKAPLVYNGNIFSISDYKYTVKKTKTEIAEIDTIMIGRGAISNPGLTNELRTENTEFDMNRFWQFHDDLYHQYQEVMSPDINVMYKMKELWAYWMTMFDNSERQIKQLMKAKKYAEYDSILRTIKDKNN